MSQSKVSSTDGNTKDYAEYSQVVCAALRFIDEHLHERFTLSDMADQLFLCRSTMVQCFRRETGTSLYAYIIHKRLLRSKELITQGVCPVQASEQSGFGDYSTFYRAFRKEFGMSPNQWKEAHKKDTGKL